MRFEGAWLQCDDRIVRPIIRGEVLAANGSWRPAEFLVDTGADRTVFSLNILESLDLERSEPRTGIAGIGGIAESVTVTTQLRLTRDDLAKVVFRGDYLACSDPESLDMSVLGRDIMEMFAVIVDRSRDFVCLLAGRHSYDITGP